MQNLEFLKEEKNKNKLKSLKRKEVKLMINYYEYETSTRKEEPEIIPSKRKKGIHNKYD